MKNKRVKVLCILDYFAPGFRAGGPIRTIENLRKILAETTDIAIFTRDRDLGDCVPFPNIQSNRWIHGMNGSVYYASPNHFRVSGLKRAADLNNFDILYLNSFFSFYASIQIYLWAHFRRKNKKILIAPRGEFSKGALAIKGFKKRLFLKLARLFRLYRNVYWHASTPLEANDILKQFPGSTARVILAEDPVIDLEDKPLNTKREKKSGQLHAVFISRVSPMKNIGGLLNILKFVTSEVVLDIYGPIEDPLYWDSCKKQISKMPTNVLITYRGEALPENVSKIFAKYDLFVFPTHGENFGHVVFEAIRAGTPVLVSDKTPWEDDGTGAIKVVPLGDEQAWREQLMIAAKRDANEQQSLRADARAYAMHYVQTSEVSERNRILFEKVLEHSPRIDKSNSTAHK